MTESPLTSIRGLRLGSYEPLTALASGGMATVYVARKTAVAGVERLVVVKRVHPHLLGNREFCDMFRDEARVCSAIRHPNVVSLIDVVEANDELLLVLEYVESLSLSELISVAKNAEARLEPAVVTRIFADTLAGLHAAHEAEDLRGNKLGLIHRDVSPQNVIVGLDGTSRLIDFGIAKAVSRISITNSGVVKGKLRYMSPEQVLQKPLDRRADIFAAGVVLHEALTGRRLFGGEDEGDIALGVLLGEIPRPSVAVAELPPSVDAVLDRALARERDERFQTALEFQEALERALAPASALDVARVVDTLGSAVLERRRAALKIALEESRVAAASSKHSTSVASKHSTSVATLPEEVAPSPPARTSRRPIALAALFVALALAAGAVAARSKGPVAKDTPASPAPSASTAAAQMAAVAAETPSVTAAAPSASPARSTPVLALSAPATSTPRATGKLSRPQPSSDLRRHNPYGTP